MYKALDDDPLHCATCHRRRHEGAGLQTGDASLNIDAPVVVSQRLLDAWQAG